MRPQLSVIMPVYNVEKYLQQAVESVLNQDFSDLELILIDDGSTDQSGDLCDGYKTDPRVQVIHTENTGISHTRNTGIPLASGEYILFFDSDDYIPEHAFSTILPRVMQNKPDMALCGISLFQDGTTDSWQPDFHYEDPVFKNGSRLEILAHLVLQQYAPWSPPKILFKRAFLNEKQLRFNSNYRHSEDCDFFMTSFLCAEAISFTDEVILACRVGRQGSLNTNIVLQSFLCIEEVFSKWACYFSARTEKVAKLIARRLADYYFDAVLYIIPKFNPTEQRQALAACRKNRWMFLQVSGFKRKCAGLIFFLFGGRCGLWLHKSVRGEKA